MQDEVNIRCDKAEVPCDIQRKLSICHVEMSNWSLRLLPFLELRGKDTGMVNKSVGKERKEKREKLRKEHWEIPKSN